jgi:hypothetical protein
MFVVPSLTPLHSSWALLPHAGSLKVNGVNALEYCPLSLWYNVFLEQLIVT